MRPFGAIIICASALLLALASLPLAAPVAFYEGDRCGGGTSVMVSIDFASSAACANTTACASIFAVNPTTPRTCASAVNCAKAATDSSQYVRCRVYDGACSAVAASYTIEPVTRNGASYFQATYYNRTGCTGASVTEGLAPQDGSCRGVCANALGGANIFCSGATSCYASAGSAIESAVQILL